MGTYLISPCWQSWFCCLIPVTGGWGLLESSPKPNMPTYFVNSRRRFVYRFRVFSFKLTSIYRGTGTAAWNVAPLYRAPRPFNRGLYPSFVFPQTSFLDPARMTKEEDVRFFIDRPKKSTRWRLQQHFFLHFWACFWRFLPRRPRCLPARWLSLKNIDADTLRQKGRGESRSLGALDIYTLWS